MRERWPGFLLILGLLVVWEVAVRSRLVDSPSLPPVSSVFGRWLSVILSGELVGHLLPSLRRLMLGYLLATLVGIPVGMLMGFIRVVHATLEPLTELIRPIPAAAYVPVAILFLGIGDTMKVFVVFLACLWPILLNTYGAVRGVDPILVDTGRTFGCSRSRLLRKVILPSIVPEVLTGMRISLGISLVVVVLAEMIAGNSGIGYFILDRQRFFRVPEMFAGIFTLAITGYTLNWLFLRVERWILRWRPSPEQA